MSGKAGRNVKRFAHIPSNSPSPIITTNSSAIRSPNWTNGLRNNSNGNKVMANNNWPANSLDLGKEQRRTTRTIAGSRAHIRTLYLILCVTLANLVLLLFVVHFRLLLIVSSQSTNSSSTNTFAFWKRVPATETEAKGRPEPEFDKTEIKREGSGEAAEKKATLKLNDQSGARSCEEDVWESELDKIKLLLHKELSVGAGPTEASAESAAEIARDQVDDHKNGEEAPQRMDGGSKGDCETCSNALSTILPKINQLILDCEVEVDSQGQERCAEWRLAGYCESHPATKWLFCRRECLCAAARKSE